MGGCDIVREMFQAGRAAASCSTTRASPTTRPRCRPDRPAPQRRQTAASADICAACRRLFRQDEGGISEDHVAGTMTLGGRRFLLSLAIVAASVCLALGVSLPIIKLTKFVFFTYEHSLISTVNALIRSGQMFLGVTVLIFSIVLPVTKLLYLLAALDAAAARAQAAVPPAARAGMARQVVDARRAGAVAARSSSSRARASTTPRASTASISSPPPCCS